MSAIDLRVDGNRRNSQTKKMRSPFRRRTRSGSLRRSTINCCRSAMFSAASRALDAISDVATARNRRISAIIDADASRFRHRVKPDDIFGTHSATRHVALGLSFSVWRTFSESAYRNLSVCKTRTEERQRLTPPTRQAVSKLRPASVEIQRFARHANCLRRATCMNRFPFPKWGSLSQT